MAEKAIRMAEMDDFSEVCLYLISLYIYLSLYLHCTDKFNYIIIISFQIQNLLKILQNPFVKQVTMSMKESPYFLVPFTDTGD